MARRRRSAPSRTWESYAAPLAFLAAATVAVLLVRSALHQGSRPGPATTPASVPAPGRTGATTFALTTTSTPGAAARYYVVRPGDSFGAIAAKTGTSVAAIEQLNPGVSSTSLHVGQKIRVR